MYFLYMFLSLIFIFIGKEVVVSQGPVFFDLNVMLFIREKIYPSFFSVMKAMDFLGGEYFMYPLAILLFIYFYKKKNIWGMGLVVASTLFPYAIMGMIKYTVCRARPTDFMLVHASGYSFPSGHTTVATAFYLNLTRTFLRNCKLDLGGKIIIFAAAIIYIALMGFSRVYVGVHWPSDVICGFVLGFITSDIGIRFVDNKFGGYHVFRY